MEENKFRNQRVFVLPNGLDKDDGDLTSGSIVVIFGFGGMAGGRGRMDLMAEPPYIPRTFEEKAELVMIHLVRFPTESAVKINYYVSSWYETPDVLNSFFDQDYIDWFKGILTSIPPVEMICKSLKVNTVKLPVPMINILYWLLIGLREPKLTPVLGESATSVVNMFGSVKQLGRVMEIFKLEQSLSSQNASKNDLLRYEYGYLGESMDNVYGFLYHFGATGMFQFFVDKIHHAFPDTGFEKPRWSGSDVKTSFCTILVLEWTPSLARLFANHESLDIPSVDDPNVFCTFSPTAIRVSYVIMLESNIWKMAIPRNILNSLNDGVIVGTSVLACLVVIRLLFLHMFWPFK